MSTRPITVPPAAHRQPFSCRPGDKRRHARREAGASLVVRAFAAGLVAAGLVVATQTPAWAQAPTAADTLRSATETARGIQAATGATAARSKLPPDDPCTALPLGLVQQIFPGARGGERSRRLEQYGQTECVWKGGKGEILLVLQEGFNSGTSARDDARGMAQGITDPLNRQALKNVRIEKVAGLPVDAAAVVETADPKRGILGDMAMLHLRQGAHDVSIGAPALPRRERAEALKALAELGRAASKRLQTGR